ncbi:TIGR04222 domain-containing membrane protein [Streptosporangium sp. NPDC023615]|uniref:TIGR04222 domain-containing membrane protein n=1 Tax=Streptosporangium sp. NPDC023615 TaxID=3154794 RepID=UPI00342A8E0F
MSLLFVVAVAIALVVILTASALRREQRRVRSVMAGNSAGPPTPYELAYLSGGPRRVINTALGLLAKAGPIRISRGGLVSLVAGAPPSPDPVEHAVMETLHQRGGSAPVGDLRRAVAEGKAMEGLRYRLLGLGLLVPDSALDHARTLLNRLLIASVAAAVFTVGCLIAGPGLRGLPTVLIGLLATIGGLSSYSRQRRMLRDTLSRSGRDVLAAAYRSHARGARPATADLAFAVGIPVALYGLGELGEPGLQEELQRPDSSGSSGACGGGSPGAWDVNYGGGGGDMGSGGWGDSGGSSGSSGDSGGSSGSSCGGGGGCGGGGCGGG